MLHIHTEEKFAFSKAASLCYVCTARPATVDTACNINLGIKTSFNTYKSYIFKKFRPFAPRK